MRSDRTEDATDPQRQLGHALGVVDRGVATVLGEVRQRGDELTVGGRLRMYCRTAVYAIARGKSASGSDSSPRTGAMSATMGPVTTTATVSGAASPTSSRTAADHGVRWRSARTARHGRAR